LLALSIAICASCFARDKRLSRSEILEDYSAHWQERQEGDKTPESKTSAADRAELQLEGSPACIDWKPKEKKGEAFQKPT
jgi:hypothetical protein